MLANAILITNSKNLSLDSTSADPYGESAHFDQERATRQRFAELKLAISITRIDNAAHCTITSPDQLLVSDASISWYRADDASLDSQTAWTDTSQTLIVQLPKSGWWWLTFTGTVDGEAVRQRQKFRF